MAYDLPSPRSAQSGFNPAGAVIFQCCLIISAWLKFSPDYIDPLADPPVIDHTDAASVMTVILSLGVLYFIYISIRWTRGAKHMGREVR